MYMGKIIDISSKLVNEPKFLQVAEGKTYKVDDRKNTVLQMNAFLNEGAASVDRIDKAIKLGLLKKLKQWSYLLQLINHYSLA